MSGNDYGDLYWQLTLADNSTVYLFADEFHVTGDGDLTFTGRSGNPDDGTTRKNLATFRAHTWKHVLAASVIDGSPINVEHWYGPIDT